MLHEFLTNNFSELVNRCRSKVATRTAPRVTSAEMEHGIPLFLGQLIETLRIEQGRATSASANSFSGGSLHEVGRQQRSEIGVTAKKHGRELLEGGFTVDQVVHDYGDLCQAVTELATEKDALVSAIDFHTFNRCLDDAIADAVTEFGKQREQLISGTNNRAMSERIGFLTHELRNMLASAMLAFDSIRSGRVSVNGSTSALLGRSLVRLRNVIDRALADVHLAAEGPPQFADVSVDHFLADVQMTAAADARAKGCDFVVLPIEPALTIHVDQQMLYSALANVLQNAFKFTRPHSRVELRAYGTVDRVLFEVEDHCGGLPEGKNEVLFAPFEQHDADRTGLGLGLSIARRAVEANKGRLTVRDLPGSGCVFTIDLPRQSPQKKEFPESLSGQGAPVTAVPEIGVDPVTQCR